jgi:hypothetical protein
VLLHPPSLASDLTASHGGMSDSTDVFYLTGVCDREPTLCLDDSKFNRVSAYEVFILPNINPDRF